MNEWVKRVEIDMEAEKQRLGFVENSDGVAGAIAFAMQCRAERLTAEERENLFSAQDIAALKKLNQGTMPAGRSRQRVYMQALADYNRAGKGVLDIAEQSHIIDPDSRAIWEHEFYVPFFRAMESGQSTGIPRVSRTPQMMRNWQLEVFDGNQGTTEVHARVQA